ncbi:MAG TPA: tetratricopeptide repeat protein, partial [Acetobacteraceae bacterium]
MPAATPNAEAVLVTQVLLHQAHEHWDDVASAAQLLVESYPNSAEGHELLATALRYTGRAAEAIPLYDIAIRLSPRDPNLFQRYGFKAFAMLQVGRYDEAATWFERSLAANPEAPASIRSARYRAMASALALGGRLKKARRAMTEANRLWSFATVRANSPENRASAALAADIAHFQEGLRRAGLRDHAEEEADFGVASDASLHQDLAGLTPIAVPGAATIRTAKLAAMLARRQLLVIDTMTYSWGRSIPGAVGLAHAGSGGEL